jgi:hypothetical protein
MDGGIRDAEPRPRARRRAARILVAAVVVLAVLFGSWLIAGNLRVASLARDYFEHSHGTGTVTNVTIDAMSPGVPPFWEVRISGDVIEAGATTPVYRLYMRLWVEPISGYIFVNGAG